MATADTIHTGYWGFSANDLAYLSDPDDRAAMRNFHFATSADWASTPPQLDPATKAITVDVANAHFQSSGVPYSGVAEFRLRRAMLTRIYGVDDPDSLTASSFRASASGSGSAPTTTSRATHSPSTFRSTASHSRSALLRWSARPGPECRGT